TNKTDRVRNILYCRPKTLKFTVTGLKPNTKHYVFFDNTDVFKYSGPLAKQYASDHSAWTDTSYADVDTGDSVDITPNRPSPNQGTHLLSNAKGELKGFFMIPDHVGSTNKDVPKFPTGGCEILVTSNAKNEKGIVFSFAKDTYTAIGDTIVTESQVTSTKRGKIATTYNDNVVNSTRSISAGLFYAFGDGQGQNILSNGTWMYYLQGYSGLVTLPGGDVVNVDTQIQDYLNKGILEQNGNFIRVTKKYQTASPGKYLRDILGTMGLAISQKSAFYQTFHIERASGWFAASIALYFTTKGKVDPVTISIVTTKEGMPSLTQLPYSIVTLSPDEVNADATGNTYTNITFPSPVYLKGGEKYAIRIKSKGDAYKVKTGKENIGERKNPMV
ncbi:uncharacterized protein METZ01_LOCUS298451, partial [marine metagenome]